MTSQDDRPDAAAELRRRAEEIAGKKAVRWPELAAPFSLEETRQTLHDLRVHQIELEMQNEELRQAQADLETVRARYFDLYDLAPVGYCTVSEAGLILEANLTAAVLLGVARGALVGRPMTRYILRDDQDNYYLLRKHLFETGTPQSCEVRMPRPNGEVFWSRLEAVVAQDAAGAAVCRVVLNDISDMKKVEEALRQALDQIKTLRGIVPICASCKKIRDDQGFWNKLETYVRDHTEAEFSHGYCPECAASLIAEYEEMTGEAGNGEPAN